MVGQPETAKHRRELEKQYRDIDNVGNEAMCWLAVQDSKTGILNQIIGVNISSWGFLRGVGGKAS